MTVWSGEWVTYSLETALIGIEKNRFTGVVIIRLKIIILLWFTEGDIWEEFTMSGS